MTDELAERVAATLAVDRDAFRDRVEAEASDLKAALRDGTFDNPQANVGFEYEFYGVSTASAGGAGADGSAGDGDPPAPLVRLPRVLVDLVGFDQELGLHNAEMNTSPQPLSGYGLTAQLAEIQARLAAAQARAGAADIRLVSDGLWTVPPTGETARGYLTESVEVEGVRIAANMAASVRYHAMANSSLAVGKRIDAPHVTLAADTVLPESLVTSIQPHYQVPHAADLPVIFGYALRLAGPLLALGANSPFFPPDLYDAGVDPDDVLADAHAEHRIGVFERTMNPTGEPGAKVGFPPDVDTVEAAVDLVADDATIVPQWLDERGRFDDRFRHFGHQHGSFWRWVRPVFDGASPASANARVEFRPLPAQPTVRDGVAFLAALAGFLEEAYAADHPVRDLPWATAEANFYAAAADGLDADLRWITAEGDRTADVDVALRDLLDAAGRGLVRRGVDEGDLATWLGPLRARVEAGRTPAAWKRREVGDRLDDGATLEAAIDGMQRAYVARQAETLLEGTFADWP